jgi:hypothetical protein
MKNGQEGAFASMNEYERQLGLTKREYFAAMVMQGLVDIHASYEFVAEHAVKYTDALLAELEKTKQQEQ